jgi:hypothetical protein
MLVIAVVPALILLYVIFQYPSTSQKLTVAPQKLIAAPLKADNPLRAQWVEQLLTFKWPLLKNKTPSAYKALSVACARWNRVNTGIRLGLCLTLARTYHYKLSLLPYDIAGKETEKQRILEEIGRVRVEMEQIESGAGKQPTHSTQMDEMRDELVGLYKRFTDLTNSY